ncbi:MAG: 16S rRNA (uracil(1498)-N(3))-methyltransferase [Desulfovibrio sp.]|jgi:16S rRNA (uracil1498-N3)-methyltransferase|nr:16S rRNA (uracil(1498)-N(3))-methyltransferase [Desulfovibrio sp.]
MNEPAFYLPPECWGAEVCLKGQDARHLARVMRLDKDSRVALLDGRGRLGLFRVCAVGKESVRLERLEEQMFPRPAARAAMALAVSKAVRRGFFLEKAVELGAHAVWIWQADHSPSKLAPSSEQSWKSRMIAGAKQCKNPWLPELRLLPGGIGEVAELASSADRRVLLWEMQENVPLLTAETAGKEGLSVYVVGPEGGFSQRELATLDAAGFAPASLGKRVLRCETAAALCLGLHWWASHLNGTATEKAAQ